MNIQNQSICISLGQNTTPSSIVSHPKEEKTFFVTVNSSGKTLNSYLSIVDFNDTEDKPKLIHRVVKHNEYLQKAAFLPNCTLLLSSKDGTGKTSLETISAPFEQIKNVKSLGQPYRNLMVSKGGEILLTLDSSLSRFDMEKLEIVSLFDMGSVADVTVCNPLSENIVLCAHNKEKKLTVYDKQAKSPQLKIEQAHNSKALALDFNPSKQNLFMATYEDCIKFWDIKKPNIPLKCADSHHNMLLNSKYNIYDELVLASYDDGTVGLFRMTAISSASTSLNNANRQEDGLVKLYDEHQDSVYQICWGVFSPWYFASLSYNSNMIINSVPSAEKHRILF